jgi:lipoate-protein ligase A
MVYIETASTNPAVNLAFEEYYLRNKSPDDAILMLWHSQPAVVVGRFQSIFAEVNLEYAKSKSIQILRRISGGGAVYHDAGNLCFSLILDRINPGMPRAATLLRPIVQALTRLGLAVEVTQRNDLRIEGKKFSGHAMMVQKDRLLLHGTLLYNANLAALRQALDGPFDDVATKAVHSVRSSVTNLCPYIPAIRTIEQFRQALKRILLESQLPSEYKPTPGELSAIEAIAADKYRSWEWTFGTDPPARVGWKCQYQGNDLRLILELDRGHLLACHLDGPPPRTAGWEEVERRLTHVRCDEASVLAALQGSGQGEAIGRLLGPLMPSAPE